MLGWPTALMLPKGADKCEFDKIGAATITVRPQAQWDWALPLGRAAANPQINGDEVVLSPTSPPTHRQALASKHRHHRQPLQGPANVLLGGQWV